MPARNAFENLAVESKQDTQITRLTEIRDYVDTVETKLTSIDAKDFATQATLAAAKTVLDNILLAVDTLEGNTDGLEGGLTSLNTATGATTDLDTANTVIGRLKKLVSLFETEDFASQTTLAQAKVVLDNILLALDGVEGLIGTTNTKLDTLIAEIDGLEEAIGTTADTDAALTVIGRLKKIVTDLASYESNRNTDADAANAKLDTANANLITLIAEVDGLEESVGTTSDLDTATTVIGRLKRLVSDLATYEANRNTDADATNVKLDTLIAEVDGLEEAIGTTADLDTANTVIGRLKKLLSDLSTYEGNRNTDADATNTKLDTLIAEVDGLEEALGTTADVDTALTVIGRLKRVITDLATYETNRNADADAANTKLDTLIAKDYATSANQSTEITRLTEIRDYLDTVETKLQGVLDNTDTLEANTDGLEGLLADVKRGATDYMTRFEWFTAGVDIGKAKYIGIAPSASAETVSHIIKKITYTTVDGAQKASRIEVKTHPWNDRDNAGWL